MNHYATSARNQRPPVSCQELESMRRLFSEKQKELAVALTKVDALSRQLDELRQGDTSNSYEVGPTPLPSAFQTEIDKLRHELLYRNKLKQQVNDQLQCKRRQLEARNTEISQVDQRIAQLQQRLTRKRALNSQLQARILQRQSESTSGHDDNQPLADNVDLSKASASCVGDFEPKNQLQCSIALRRSIGVGHAYKLAQIRQQQLAANLPLHSNSNSTANASSILSSTNNSNPKKNQSTNTIELNATSSSSNNLCSSSASTLSSSSSSSSSTSSSGCSSAAIQPTISESQLPVSSKFLLLNSSSTSGQSPNTNTCGSNVITCQQSSPLSSSSSCFSSADFSSSCSPSASPPAARTAEQRSAPSSSSSSAVQLSSSNSVLLPTSSTASSVNSSSAVTSSSSSSSSSHSNYRFSSLSQSTQTSPADQLGIERGLVFKSIQQLQQKNVSIQTSSAPSLPSASSSTQNNALAQSQHRTPLALVNQDAGKEQVNSKTNNSKLTFAQLSFDSPIESTKASASHSNQTTPLIQCHTSASNSSSVSASALSSASSFVELTRNSSNASNTKNAIESSQKYSNGLSNGISLGQPFTITTSASSLTNSSNIDSDSKSSLCNMNSSVNNSSQMTTSMDCELTETESKQTTNRVARPLSGSAGSSLSGSLDSELDSAIHSCSQTTITSSTNGNTDSLSNRAISTSDHKQWMLKRRPLVVDADNESQLERVNRLLKQTQQMKLSEDIDSLMDLFEEEDTAPSADDSEQDDHSSVFDAPDPQIPISTSVALEALHTFAPTLNNGNTTTIPQPTDSSSDQPDRGHLKTIEPDSTTDESISQRFNRSETSEECSSGNEELSNHSSSEKENDDCNNQMPVIRRSKSNLKQIGSKMQPRNRRVCFDPLALFLDAALEGELDLIKQIASQVPNPSASFEGITALHNAICAGHFDIVRHLVEIGCDVNAPDNDGWTPLHCAASCNNQPMVKYLVEHGACIFATTLSDNETPAEKCEELEDGYQGCYQYLHGMEEKLGVLNGGAVYAVYDYTAQNDDELSFQCGQLLWILRKSDEQESHWWWATDHHSQGYVPCNLLSMYPRVKPKSKESVVLEKA